MQSRRWRVARLIVALWLLACCLVWRAVPLPSQLPVRRENHQWVVLLYPWRGRVMFVFDVRLMIRTR
jgi:hypothetical protein